MKTGEIYKQKKMDSQQFYTDLFFLCWTLSLPWLQQQLRQQRLLQRALSVIKQSKPSSTGSILSSAIGFYASHATMLAAAVIGEWSSHSHNMVCNCCRTPPLFPSLYFLVLHQSLAHAFSSFLPPFFLSPFLIFSLSPAHPSSLHPLSPSSFLGTPLGEKTMEVAETVAMDTAEELKRTAATYSGELPGKLVNN